MKFLDTIDGKITEVNVNIDDGDVVFYRNNVLGFKNFDGAERNFEFLDIRYKKEIEDYVYKMISDFEIDYHYIEDEFTPLVNAKDVVFVINGELYSLFEILKKVFSKKINSYFELQQELIKVFAEYKGVCLDEE